MIASSGTIKAEAIEAIIERAIAGDEVAFAYLILDGLDRLRIGQAGGRS
jgi:hypothetical protein